MIIIIVHTDINGNTNSNKKIRVGSWDFLTTNTLYFTNTRSIEKDIEKLFNVKSSTPT